MAFPILLEELRNLKLAEPEPEYTSNRHLRGLTHLNLGFDRASVERARKHSQGAIELWNHPPLFAYQDRYIDIQLRPADQGV